MTGPTRRERSREQPRRGTGPVGVRALTLAAALLAGSGWAQAVADPPPEALSDAGVGLLPAAPAAPPPTFYERHFHGAALLTRSLSYEVSFVAGAGGLVHAPGAGVIPLTGLSFRENNGVLSLALGALFGPALSKLRPVDLSNGPRAAPDGSSERAQHASDGKAPARLGVRDGLAGVTFFELSVYADGFLGWNRGATGASGYELAVGAHGELFAVNGLPFIVEAGFELANVRVPAPTGSGVGGPFLYWASGGLLVRGVLPVTRFLTVSLEWILNALSIEYLLESDAQLLAEGRVVSSPLKLTAELHLTDHAFVRAQGLLGGLGVTGGRLGGLLTLGVRL